MKQKEEMKMTDMVTCEDCGKEFDIENKLALRVTKVAGDQEGEHYYFCSAICVSLHYE